MKEALARSGREILKEALRRQLEELEATEYRGVTLFIARARQRAERARLGLQLAMLEVDDALDALGDPGAQPVEIADDGRVVTDAK